jgi:hypothetical protein
MVPGPIARVGQNGRRVIINLRDRRGAVAAVAACLLMAACAGGDDETATTTLPDATIEVPVTPITIAGVETTLPDTAPPGTLSTTTAPPTTSPLPEVTDAETTLPATTPEVSPATTEPLAVQELVLTGEGLGSAVFGADPDAVIEYVTSILGGNTDDTGWVDPFSFAACDGSIARRVDWGVLSLLFTDLSGFANGRRHFIGYEYGRVGQVGDDPVGLRTPGGITLGSRVVDLLAEFPDAVVNPGEPASGFPDNFYVSDVFYGLLTGTTEDDYVTVLFGGYGCGE